MRKKQINTYKGVFKVASNKTKYITKIGVFSAIAFILTLLEFSLTMFMPIFPDFLTIEFSNVISIIGGITLGPVAAVTIELIKNILKTLLFTKTGGIGELANLIGSVAYVLPIVIIYKRKSSMKSITLGMIIGTILAVIAYSLANFYLIFPLYMGGLPTSDKIKMITNIYAPFTLVKSIIVSIAGVIIVQGMKGIFKYIKQ
jgi:riboflavin transporter FmnP